MVGLTFFFAATAMGVFGKGRRVSIPIVATGGTIPVALGQGSPQITGALQTAVTQRPADNLAGAAAQGHPEPELAGFAADETPEFVQFEHVAVFSGQERIHEGRQSFRFFPPPSE